MIMFKNATAIRSTPKAILVESKDFKKSPQWIPQSVVTDESEVWKTGQSGTLTITDQFAISKGWV